MPKASPSSSIKILGLSRHFVFIVSCTVVLFLEHLSFQLLFLVFLVFLSKVGYNTLLLERHTLCLHCLEHSSFHSYCFVSVHFCQHCVQPQFSCAFSLELFSSYLCICETRSMIFIDYYLCDLFQISYLVLERVESFMLKWYKRELVLTVTQTLSCHARCCFELMLNDYCCSITCSKQLRLLSVH